jgi:hypothetical protein
MTLQLVEPGFILHQTTKQERKQFLVIFGLREVFSESLQQKKKPQVSVY